MASNTNNENDGFNPLDSLGPSVGNMNSLNPDSKNYTPFEGDPIEFDKVTPPALDNPLIPKGLTNQSRQVKKYIVGQPPGKAGISYNSKNISSNQKADLIRDYISASAKSNQQKNSYGKLYSYNAGSKGNAHFQKYYAYGAETFDKIGFNPLRNNEENFNNNTSVWQDFGRQLTNSFVPLFNRGFVAGPKSLGKMLVGDFTSGDLDDARKYEDAAAIGTSTKKGFMPFLSNTFMNFGYTAGIISEIIAEEIVGGVLAPVTGGLSFLSATKNSISNVYKAAKGIKFAKDVENTAGTLQSLNNLKNANSFWKDANYLLDTPVGSFINPLNNTRRSLMNAKASNLTNLATSFKTAGGFYQDVRSINAAISESRLEAGMVQNKVYDNKYDQFYLNNKRAPTDKEQEDMTRTSEKAGLETFYKNVGLIYGTNKITFGNILNKGGLKNFTKNLTQDVMNVSHKSFGSIGKVLYDKTSKKFLYETSLGLQGFKNLAKSWTKNPLHKSVLSTIKYTKSNFSEGFQENAQEIISRANERWYTDSYNSPYLKSSLFYNAINNVNLKNNGGTPLSVYNDEMKKEFSGQGFETFASGFLMGTLGGGLNKTFSGLSNTFSKIYDKKGFEEWTNQKELVTKTLINELNNIDIKDLLSNTYVNAGSQDTLSLIKEKSNTKVSKDAELESLIQQVSVMTKTGSSDIFKEKLESLKEMTNEELQEELKYDDLKDSDRYRLKIDKTLSKIDSIQNAFEIANENFPNPINNTNLPDKSDPNYIEAVAIQHGWNAAVKNIVYANESFKDVTDRISKIKNTYLKNGVLKNISNSKISPLFQVNLLADNISAFENELDILKKGVSSKTSVTIEADKIQINSLKEQIKTLKDYKVSYDAFNKFTNRSEYTQEIKDSLAIDSKTEITAEDIENKMSIEYGKEDDEEKMIEVFSNLKKSHDAYINTLAKSIDGDIFSVELDDAFEQLVDFYKLKDDSRNLVSHINLLSDPENFYGLVRKNSEWSKKLYKKRKKYFTNLVNEQISNIESNALLNALADLGIYMSAEEFSSWQKLRIKPSEFYNSITKEVYKKDTTEYNKIYDEYMKKDLELKAIKTFKETETLKTEYANELVELNNAKEKEIEALEKIDTKKTIGTIQPQNDNKSINSQEISNTLNNEEYVEVKTKNSEVPIVFYKDDNGVLRNTDEFGEPVDLNDKTRYFENEVYTIERLPDPKALTEIENRYAQDELNIIESFKDSASVVNIEFEDTYDINKSDFKEMPDGLKKDLYTAYESTLENKTAEERINMPSDMSDEFQTWIKTDASAKTIIDAFNEKVKLVSDYEFQNGDKKVNTKDLTSRNIQDSINTKTEELKKLDEDFKKLKEDDPEYDIKKLEIEKLKDVITALYKAIKFKSQIPQTKAQKDVIKKLDKLVADNKKLVTKNYTLTEDDAITGLKKGEKAYLIDGKIHRRVTNAIQEFLKNYEYSSKKLVEDSYNKTIKLKGLNEASIADFIKLLKDGKAAGINDILYTELNDFLKSLTTENKNQVETNRLQNEIKDLEDNIVSAKTSNNNGRVRSLKKELKTLTAELAALGTDTEADIDNEELYDKVYNFISEKSYEDGRVAGNYVDLIKDYFEFSKKPKFDEEIISKKAYEELFGENGYIVNLKKQFDAEGLIIKGNDLVVWDSNIVDKDGNLDRIAGEIDLIAVDKEGNTYIIDIKTGSKSKWLSFNTLTTSTDKPSYSKRNEYTLQQATYQRLLNKMIGVEAGIALLPIQRESDPKTNQIVSAKKPDAAGLEKIVKYEFFEDSVKLNKYGEKIFYPTTETGINDIFIPLSLDSVKEEMDKLLPLEIQDKKEEEKDLSLKADTIERDLLKISSKKIIEYFKDKLAISTEDINKLSDTLSKIKIPDVSKINISNDFINERLTLSESTDNVFKYFYDKHDSFKDSTDKQPHENQLMAIEVLHNSKIITENEYQSIDENNLSMAEVSELIHNAVIRIEYLKAEAENSDAPIEALEFKKFQELLLKYMGKSKSHTDLQNINNNLNLILLEVANNKIVLAYALLDNEIKTLNNKLNYAKVQYQKDILTDNISKLTTLKNNLVSLYGEVKQEVKNPIEVGDRYFMNNTKFTKMTVIKVDGDYITIKGNRKNSKETIVNSKDLLNKELYLTPEDIENLKSEESNYEANESEKIILKNVQNTTETFINSTEDKNKATEIGLKDTIENIETDLLTEIKNCQ